MLFPEYMALNTVWGSVSVLGGKTMYVLKIDLPTGIAYFTGKKKVVQGSEAPGLTGDINGARFFVTEEEATKFCKMLVKKYDMEFYYSLEEKSETSTAEDNAAEDEDSFMIQLDKDLIAGVMEAEAEDQQGKDK